MNFWPIKIKIKTLFLLLAALMLAIYGIVYFKDNIWKNAESQRPNVILISIDSLRADHLSAYGYSRKTTPNIDDLAKEGVLFKNYFSQSYLTPVSEMSVHTGMYPSSSGLIGFDTILPNNVLTLAQILKKYGYQSAAFGNSPEFIIFEALKDSFNRGFDSYDISIFREKMPDPEKEKVFNFIKSNPEKPFFVCR